MRLLLLFLLFFYGCSTLPPVQSEQIKSFATSVKLLSAVPGELYQDISDYRHQLKLVESSTLYSSDKIVPRLNRLLQIKKQFDDNALQIHHSAFLIESYAKCLLALTDANYQNQLDTAAENLSLQISTALTSYNQAFTKNIPVNVGSFISHVVMQVGSVKLRQLQRRYLKSFVDTGSVVINEVCDYFTTTVAASLEQELASLDKQFVNVMTTFYDNLYEYQKAQNINPFDYLRQYNPLYLQMKEKLEGLHHLRQKMVASLLRVKEAHEQLRQAVNAPEPGKLLTEIKELYAATRDVQLAYRKLRE